MNESVAVLEVRDLTVCFKSGAGRITAVADADVSVAAGETVGLVGGSGAGKSTVARAVAGLVAADRGEIHLDGTDLLTLRRAEARQRRRALHLVFQDPYASLPPTLRAGDVIAEPLVIHRIGDREERRDRVTEAMAAVHLPERFRARYVHQLSGGERQRVALARALATRPRLVLADEPTAMLDASLRRDLVDLLRDLAADRGMAVLHITHDLALAQHGCTRIVVMRGGRVVENGPTDEVLGAPQHEYTKALVAACRGREGTR